MDEIEMISKLHKFVFDKSELLTDVLWRDLKANPTSTIVAALKIGASTQTFELGYILGAALVYGMHHDPLGVKPMLDGIIMKMKVDDNVSRIK